MWRSWDGPISIMESRRRTNVYGSPALCQAPYTLPHLVFTEPEFSSPFYRLRQLRFRVIKKLTQGFLPPKWRSWGWSTFLSPKLMSFPSWTPSPNPPGLQQDLGSGGQNLRGTTLVTEQLGKWFMFPHSAGWVPFLSLCPSYINFMHHQLRATDRRLSDLCLCGRHRVVPSWTCHSRSLCFWVHLWAGFSGTSWALCPDQSRSVATSQSDKALIPGETRLKKTLGMSQHAVGEYLWNEWICCILETPVNRSGFACSPTFVLGSFPTVFIWKQVQIISQVTFISLLVTLAMYLC